MVLKKKGKKAVKKLAKKATKKTKRAYVRKLKPVEVDVATTGQMSIAEDGARQNQAEEIPNWVRTRQLLQEIDVIDFSNMDIKDRFLTLVMLDDAGYVHQNGGNPLLRSEIFDNIHDLKGLRLQNANFLVTAVYQHDFLEGVWISEPMLQVNILFSMSFPQFGQF